jgi:hypothetical protein
MQVMLSELVILITEEESTWSITALTEKINAMVPAEKWNTVWKVILRYPRKERRQYGILYKYRWFAGQLSSPWIL